MRIPLVDLSAQYQTIRDEVLPAIERVLEGMHLYLGPEQTAFEREFAQYCESRFGIGVANGTDALTVALRACGIGTGDDVITVSHTFIATAEAIALVGARPIFVDIDPATYTMDWRQLEAALTPRTRAIIPVHLYGHPADMAPILDFARAHQLRVIEDASQAHGALYNGQRVGGLGDIGCFSLYYSKNLGAYGEAGICVTDDERLADAMYALRDHGSRVRYHHDVLGANSRLDEIQAAILRIKLRHLDEWNEMRRAHAQHYATLLAKSGLVLPASSAWAAPVYHLFVVQVPERERLRAALEQAGIASGIHYPIPVHLQPACAYLGYARGSLPRTEMVAERVLSLPMYAELTSDAIDVVADQVTAALDVAAMSR